MTIAYPTQRVRALLLALAGPILAETASAADKFGSAPVVREAPPQFDRGRSEAPIWQGFYWGATLGYGFGRSEQTYDRAGDHGFASTSPEGGAGALTLGYNMLWSPNILIGIEGDLGIMDISADDKVVYDGHIYRTSFGPWWGTLRGRAGLLFHNTLLYGTGGLAIMDVDEVSIGNTPGETATNEDLRTGFVVGGGVEHALSSGVTAKVEYLHMDFGRFEGYSANNEAYSFDNRVDLIRAGLNFKF